MHIVGPTTTPPEIYEAFATNLPLYAEFALKIRTKNHGIQPLTFNRSQLYLHSIAEQQLVETGKVRILVLKGRQCGISTYTAARFFHKVTHGNGLRAFILCHASDATHNLFDMANRFYEHLDLDLKPEADRQSRHELNFGNLDSGYRTGTAGVKGAGRSATYQYLHGSEVAFWRDADEHAKGALQAVPNNSGEIFLESTSDGMGGYFHQLWRDAKLGLNEYIAVFIPWWWQDEYRSNVPEATVWDDSELVYQESHGIDNKQLMFRREKTRELGGELQFKREYPANPAEAFEASSDDQLIKTEWLTQAIEYQLSESRGALVLGVDPARYGADYTALVLRRGREVIDAQVYKDLSLMETVGIVKTTIDYFEHHKQYNPLSQVFIDVGMGAGVIDRLLEMDYEVVKGIDFGARALNEEIYVNRRNEMWQEMGNWFEGGSVSLPAGMPLMDALVTDLSGVRYSFDVHNRKVLERKELTKKRTGKSPDIGDALALTFAEHVLDWFEHQYIVEQPRRAWIGRSPKTGY